MVGEFLLLIYIFFKYYYIYFIHILYIIFIIFISYLYCAGKIPAFEHTIFPTSSLSTFGVFANIGLIVFMFLVGLELDSRLLTKNARNSIIVSLSDMPVPCRSRMWFDGNDISVVAMVAPFGLGLAASIPIYNNFIPATVRFTSFLLFVAVALSITAVSINWSRRQDDDFSIFLLLRFSITKLGPDAKSLFVCDLGPNAKCASGVRVIVLNHLIDIGLDAKINIYLYLYFWCILLIFYSSIGPNAEVGFF
jgi:hypothetical protein